MEAIFFVLIGAALFSSSWNLLGLYSDGRTMGLFTGALGLGSLIALSFAPMVFVGGDADANVLAEISIAKMLIVAWAAYAVGVGAQGLWDFDDRAIGFYSAILTAITAVAFFYYAANLGRAYGEDAALAVSVGNCWSCRYWPEWCSSTWPSRSTPSGWSPAGSCWWAPSCSPPSDSRSSPP